MPKAVSNIDHIEVNTFHGNLSLLVLKSHKTLQKLKNKLRLKKITHWFMGLLQIL